MAGLTAATTAALGAGFSAFEGKVAVRTFDAGPGCAAITSAVAIGAPGSGTASARRAGSLVMVSARDSSKLKTSGRDSETVTAAAVFPRDDTSVARPGEATASATLFCGVAAARETAAGSNRVLSGSPSPGSTRHATTPATASPTTSAIKPVRGRRRISGSART